MPAEDFELVFHEFVDSLSVLDVFVRKSRFGEESEVAVQSLQQRESFCESQFVSPFF